MLSRAAAVLACVGAVIAVTPFAGAYIVLFGRDGVARHLAPSGRRAPRGDLTLNEIRAPDRWKPEVVST